MKHFTEMELAELERHVAGRGAFAFDDVGRLLAELKEKNLQLRDYQNVVGLAIDDLTVAKELGGASDRVDSTIRILKEVLATAGTRGAGVGHGGGSHSGTLHDLYAAIKLLDGRVKELESQMIAIVGC